MSAHVRGTTGTSYIDVLDRVLDKGMLIDASMRVSFAGIDLLSVEARVLVASIDTYVTHAVALRSSRLRSELVASVRE